MNPTGRCQSRPLDLRRKLCNTNLYATYRFDGNCARVNDCFGDIVETVVNTAAPCATFI
jgi:hypothetical protein